MLTTLRYINVISLFNTGLTNSDDGGDSDDDDDDDDAIGLLQPDAQPIASPTLGYNNPNGEYDDSPVDYTSGMVTVA